MDIFFDMLINDPNVSPLLKDAFKKPIFVRGSDRQQEVLDEERQCQRDDERLIANGGEIE